MTVFATVVQELVEAGKELAEEDGEQGLAHALEDAGYAVGAADTFAENHPVEAAVAFLAGVAFTTVLAPELVADGAAFVASEAADVVASRLGARFGEKAIEIASKVISDYVASKAAEEDVKVMFHGANLVVAGLQDEGAALLAKFKTVDDADGTSKLKMALPDYATVVSKFSGPNGTGQAISRDLEIDPGATVGVWDSREPSGVANDITFLGSSDTLKIGDVAGLHGTIFGFQAGDTIDLTGVAATGATLGANNVLTVQESDGASVNIDLAKNQNYSGDIFETNSDSNGGTDIVVEPNPTDLGFSLLGIYSSSDIVDTTNAGWNIVSNNNQILAGPFISQDGIIQEMPINFNGQAVNDSGQIAGELTVSTQGTIDTEHAALSQNGIVTDLGTLDGTGSSEAFGINDAGDVVGDSSSSSYITRAFLWQNDTMTDLGTLGGTYSSASDINNADQVVGESATSNGYSDAFLWQNGVMTNLGSLIANGDSVAQAINNDGQVVGGSSVSPNMDSTAFHAVLWQGGAMTDLGTLGGLRSEAYGINDEGQIVGASQLSPTGGNDHAFLWQDGTMTDLNNLLPAGSGWLLEYALSINDNGQIVGNGTHNGVFTGFELTLPSSLMASSSSLAASSVQIHPLA